MNNPKHQHTVIAALKATREASQEELKNYHPEEPAQEIPGTYHGKVWLHLNKAEQNANTVAKKLKAKNLSENKYIHHEAFPQELYDELQKPKRTSFKEELEDLGYEFYMTNEGNGPRHSMVRFTLEF